MTDRHKVWPKEDAVANNEADPPAIPDHRLLRCIGRGSYGAVWLSQNSMGTYRAVKIVHRSSFKDERPFERELAGIRKFEPISRSHEGFVHVLHVGINAEKGYFCYVMELGDDETTAQNIDPEKYVPKTLGKDISTEGKLSLRHSLQLGLALSLALASLHERGLVHRDIKPSNIIFVNGIPKLADIGLVTDINDARSYVGTEGFIPPEGPGSAKADIYSLGKVLYEACTGKDRQDFPELPTRLDSLEDRGRLLELNEVILKACKNDLAGRYQSAWDMHADLLIIVNGKSVRRLRLLEARLSRFKKIAGTLGAIFAVLALILFQVYREFSRAREARERRIGETIAYGNQAVDSSDFLGALPHFVEAMQLDAGDAAEKAAHRLLVRSTLMESPKLIQLWSMNRQVEAAALSQDGKRVVVACSDGQINLFDAESGNPTAREFVSERYLYDIFFSPDERLAVTGSQHYAALWNVSTGKLLFQLPHSGLVRGVRFSPDGRSIVTADRDGAARIWSVKDGTLSRVLKGHTKPCRFANFSPDGRLIVTGSEDYTARIWSAETGAQIGESLPHGGWVVYAAFSPDNKTLITACGDHKARLWDVATGRRILVDLIHNSGVECVDFSPDGRMIVTASNDGTARVWEMQGWQSIVCTVILRHKTPVTRAFFAPDGHRILTSCLDGTVRIWDLAAQEVMPSTQKMIACKDGSRYLNFSDDSLTVWNADSEKPIFNHATRDCVTGNAQLSDTGHFLSFIKASSNSIPSAQIWNVDTGEQLGIDLPMSTNASNVVISRDGTKAVIYGKKEIQIWDVPGHAKLSETIEFTNLIKTVIFAPDDKSIAVASGEFLSVLDSHGNPTLPMLEQRDALTHVAFSGDGSRIVTCCANGNIEGCPAVIWDAATGAKLQTVWHEDGVLCAEFSPDGRLLATSSEDYTARIWDTRTGRQIGPDLKHTDQVLSVEFSPDGGWVVTACRDWTARVWDARTGEPLTPLLRHLSPLRGARFLSGGSRIITSDLRGGSWMWNLATTPVAEKDFGNLAQLLTAKPVSPDSVHTNRDAESLVPLWNKLRSEYPSAFVASSNEIVNWQQFEAEKSRQENDAVAAAFHLRQGGINQASRSP